MTSGAMLIFSVFFSQSRTLVNGRVIPTFMVALFFLVILVWKYPHRNTQLYVSGDIQSSCHSKLKLLYSWHSFR